MSENKDKSKEDEEDDPDFYIRTIASTWGHLDLIADWLPHHRHEPDKVTHNVLFPASMYGLLGVLQLALKDGEFGLLAICFILDSKLRSEFVCALLNSVAGSYMYLFLSYSPASSLHSLLLFFPFFFFLQSVHLLHLIPSLKSGLFLFYYLYDSSLAWFSLAS